MQITQKCAFIHFSARMFSPERELGRRDKNGAVIKSEKIQIVSPKTLNQLINAKNIGDRACRQVGSRFDVMNAFLVPLEKMEYLTGKLKDAATTFEEKKADYISKFPGYVDAQILANPLDETAIRAAMPSIAELEKSIRVSWVRHTLVPEEIEDYGLAREFDGVAEQVAWEIAQDIKVSTGQGTKYSKNTLDVLTRAAEKAESFGFLSDSLRAIKPAVQQLRASVNLAGFTPADRLIIGAMISFLSDHKKVMNEGRHINGILDAPMQAEQAIQTASVFVAATQTPEVPPLPVEAEAEAETYSF